MILAGRQEFKSKHILQAGGKCRSLSVPRLHDSRPWLSFWSTLGACAFCALQRHRHVPGFVGRYSPECCPPGAENSTNRAPYHQAKFLYYLCRRGCLSGSYVPDEAWGAAGDPRGATAVIEGEQALPPESGGRRAACCPAPLPEQRGKRRIKAICRTHCWAASGDQRCAPQKRLGLWR